MPWQEGKTGAVCLPRSSTHSRMLPWADRDLNLQQDQGPMRRKRRRRKKKKKATLGTTVPHACQSYRAQWPQQCLAQAQTPFGEHLPRDIPQTRATAETEVSPRKGQTTPRARPGVAPPSRGGQEAVRAEARRLARIKHTGAESQTLLEYFISELRVVLGGGFLISSLITTNHNCTAQQSSSRHGAAAWAPAVPRAPRGAEFSPGWPPAHRAVWTAHHRDRERELHFG